MNTWIIFIWIYAAMIATSYWEAYIEGKNPWARKQVGWKLKLGKKYSITAYHFFLFGIAYPLLIFLPLLFIGFSWKIFGILLSAYASGLVIEDFFWFIADPYYSLKKFNSKYVYWYPWLKIGRLEIPWLYILGIGIAVLSWYFLWG